MSTDLVRYTLSRVFQLAEQSNAIYLHVKYSNLSQLTVKIYSYPVDCLSNIIGYSFRKFLLFPRKVERRREKEYRQIREGLQEKRTQYS